MKERLEAEAQAVEELKANLAVWRGEKAAKPEAVQFAVIEDMRDKHGWESSQYFAKNA